MRQVLRFPEDIKAICTRRYRNQCREWIGGSGTWPMHLLLGSPSESEVQIQPQAVREWVSAWRAWQGPGDLLWCERQLRNFGLQTLPERLILQDAHAVATWAGEEKRWNTVVSRFHRVSARWPRLAATLCRHLDDLAGYSDLDMIRLESLVAWIESNPRSNFYPRQIPLPGLDTKWLESRTSLLTELIGALQFGEGERLDFHERCGLRKPPHMARLRILDKALRDHIGGLSDITAPVIEVAKLPLTVSRVYIVENIQTGLCFGERPDSLAFMGLGYGVSALAQVPWVADAECVYWGDVDTHGFAMLSLARASLPSVISVLMDEGTLLANRNLWGQENDQYTSALASLTLAEQRVYDGLRRQQWGLNVRLEQERIEWDRAWEVLNS